MKSFLSIWLMLWLCAASAGGHAQLPHDVPDCEPQIVSVMAAKSEGATRPVAGWQAVILPDNWSQRWPDYDGTVWYRIDWQPGCVDTDNGDSPVGLVIESIIMAGAVYSEDTLLWRDRHLQEPLSRSWNSPRYWLLPASHLREGRVLWVRVAGVAAQTPGLGRVRLGSPEAMLTVMEQGHWRTRTLPFINLVVSAVLGFLALFIWLAFRSQQVFGWYAVTAFCWVLFGVNTLATQAWPFSDTRMVAQANTLAYIFFIASFCVFSWRLLELRCAVWREFPLLALVAGLAGVIVLSPGWEGLQWAGHISSLVFLLNGLCITGWALRRREAGPLMVAGFYLLLIAIGVRDVLILIGLLSSDFYLSQYSCLLFMLMAAVFLGLRVAGDARRIERFNQELSVAIEKACDDLSATMSKEHRLALDNTRLQERLQLAHDLHDGLGGQLVRSIMMVEQSDDGLDKSRYLSMLKLLRDDLRQLVDSGASASASAAPPQTPVEWLAPLRYRFANLFDALEMLLVWNVPDAWRTQPTAVQCLLLARLVEEALTNIVKHSQARCARVTLQLPDDALLLLRVEDDGVGFDVAAVQGGGLGIGLESMRARTERHGGALTLCSQPGATVLEVRLPLGRS